MNRLEQIRKHFASADQQESSRPNNYYPFWNMQIGEQAVVRFLPDRDPENPTGFLVEKLMHNLVVNGEKQKVPCLKMFGDDCPICKVSSSFYKAKDEDNGKKYWRKKQHIAQALIVDDPLPADKETGETHEGKVRFLALGYQLFNIIKDTFESGELDEVPFSYDGGYNFVIKKTEQGKYSTYTVGSKFVRKASSLTEDEIAVVEEEMVELSTLLPAKPTIEKVESMLEASLNGSSYEHDSVSSDSVSSDSVSSSVDDTSVSDDGEVNDDDVLSLLEEIKSRTKNRT